jgi:hypothetical protein
MSGTKPSRTVKPPPASAKAVLEQLAASGDKLVAAWARALLIADPVGPPGQGDGARRRPRGHNVNT